MIRLLGKEILMVQEHLEHSNSSVQTQMEHTPFLRLTLMAMEIPTLFLLQGMMTKLLGMKTLELIRMK